MREVFTCFACDTIQAPVIMFVEYKDKWLS